MGNDTCFAVVKLVAPRSRFTCGDGHQSLNFVGYLEGSFHFVLKRSFKLQNSLQWTLYQIHASELYICKNKIGTSIKIYVNVTRCISTVSIRQLPCIKELQFHPSLKSLMLKSMFLNLAISRQLLNEDISNIS